jgi:hypothetical protein
MKATGMGPLKAVRRVESPNKLLDKAVEVSSPEDLPAALLYGVPVREADALRAAKDNDGALVLLLKASNLKGLSASFRLYLSEESPLR